MLGFRKIIHVNVIKTHLYGLKMKKMINVKWLKIVKNNSFTLVLIL